MIIHNFNPILVDLGVLQIKWYSLAYIFGIVIGWAYANKIIRLNRKNKYNYAQITTRHFDDLIVYLVIGIVLGGRMGYVIFYNLEYFTHNFLEIFQIWQGGMSFHGGLLGVIISILIYSKKTNSDFYIFTDIVSCVAPIGIFFGRIANFINAELYGKVSNLPWAVIFPNTGNLSRHPSQIYEAILEGIVLFLLINYLSIKKNLLLKTGYISGLFLIFYSILRIFSEIFREPDTHIGYIFNYFSLGVLLSLITLIAGFLIVMSIKKNEQSN